MVRGRGEPGPGAERTEPTRASRVVIVMACLGAWAVLSACGGGPPLAVEHEPAAAGTAVAETPDNAAGEAGGGAGAERPTSHLATPTAIVTPAPIRTATATATATPRATTGASPTLSGARTWYTSAAGNAKYYYCDLDDQWRDLSPKNLRSYPSEEALLAEWGAARMKHPKSRC